MKNLGHRLLVIFICVTCLILVACANEENYQEYYQNLEQTQAAPLTTMESSAEEFTDVEMNQAFTGDYGWDKLISHQAYWNGEVVQIDFHFAAEVPRWQLDAARSYALTKFQVGSYNNLAPYPYDTQLLEDEHNQKIKRVYCQIFIDEVLAVQDFYQGHEVTFYENTAPYFPARKFGSNYVEQIIDTVKADVSNATVTLQKSLLGYPLIIQVENKRVIDPQIVEKWEQYLEAELAPLAKGNRVIVLQLYANGKNYYESAYLNMSHDQRWLGQDWMNFDYFLDTIGRRAKQFTTDSSTTA